MTNPSSATHQTTKPLNVAYKGYKDGSADFFGDRIQAMTGYSSREFSSGIPKWTDLIVEEDRPVARAVFVEALKTDRTYQREYRIKARSGDIIWIHEISQIICSENGEIDFIAGHLVDVTHEKREEQTRLKSEERSGKYLTFSLGDQEYAIGALKVKEITGMMPVTPFPQAPEFVMGVINLRGKVIPVIDLLNRFGMKPVADTDRACIVVTEACMDTIGIVVNSVSDVVTIKGSEIEDAPAFGSRTDIDHILGMAKTQDGLKILLDIDRVWSGAEA